MISDIINTVEVVLPEKYELVVGDVFQLFYRGVIDAPAPLCFDILAVCEKGRNYPRYFEYLPEEEGEYKLKIQVFGPGKKLLGEGKTLLNVLKPKKPEKPINILCIGDSLTGMGQWPSEAHRRLTASDGEPVGLSFDNINFIGTCKKGSTGYEGYGGWKWESYYTSECSSVWIECAHDKSEEDQHSLWQDENGSLWQLETLEKNRLKFNRAYMHSNPIPQKGALTHYQYATNKSSIDIVKSYEEQNSPFFDEKTNKVNFVSYCERNGFSGIDAVYILLGCNGWQEAFSKNMSVSEHCQDIVKKGKKFVKFIHDAYPDAQIKIMGQAGCSVNGGTGASYGAKEPYCDDYGFFRFVMELNKAYEAWTKEPKYSDYMEFINISGQFDADYNMQYTQKRVNTRSTQVEVIGTNGVHPSNEGYMQIADAAFRNMVHFCKK